MESSVQSFGKVRYIDPNSILQDRKYNTDTDNPQQYNIPFNPEDYCIAVDLIVNTPQRNGKVLSFDKQYAMSTGDESFTVSFFGGNRSFEGDNSFLSDNPGSITYSDLIANNGSGVQENLGITNIHITYNSYHYPQVTIHFTDVRGAALMMPHEENYRRQQLNKNSETPIYQANVESFFTSLFSFPYPEFKLRVKGFYGKMVEYSLLVEDFRSSFNAQTGNFDATVKFIGRMFGLYTDIPMSYLLIAPYCKYGMNGDKTLWQQFNFKLDGTTQMPTLIEMKKQLISANKKLETDMAYEKVQIYQKLNKRLENIRTIKDAYQELISYIKGNVKRKKDAIIGRGGVEYHIFFEKVISNTKPCPYLYENGCNISELTQKIYDLIENYNESDGGDTKIPHLGNFKTKKDTIGYSSREKDCIRTYLRNTGTDLEVTIDGKRPESEILEAIRSGIKAWHHDVGFTDSEYYFVPFDCREFSKTIKTIEKSTKDELNKIKNEIEDEYMSRMKGILGYAPSIRNIFKTVMAHLQTFIYIYVKFLSNVTGKNSRKMKDYGFSEKNTDISLNGGKTNDTDIPPFPAIIDINTNEYSYPSDIISKKMEEENLIDCLFDGTFFTMNKNDETDEEVDELLDESLELIPTCLTDFVNVVNPYESVFDARTTDMFVDWIMTYFGLRCITNFIVEKGTRLTAAEFGKCEAYNFWRANQTLSKENIEKLNNTEFNETSFIGFLQNSSGNPYVVDSKPCYTFSAPQNGSADKKTHSKLLTKNESDSSMTCNGYHIPASIGRDGGDFKTFISDTQNDSNNGVQKKYAINGNDRISARETINEYVGAEGYKDITYKLRSYVPYYYIQLSDVDVLSSWNSKLNELDTSSYIDGEKKVNIIEQYLTPTKDIFVSKRNIRYRTDPITPHSTAFIRYNNENSDINKDMDGIEEYYQSKLDGKYYLDTFYNYEDTPIFFEPNLSPAIFLCSIPFNFEKIAETLKNGRTCFTMPKVLELFIGLCIKRILNHDSGKNIDGIVKRVTSENYKEGDKTETALNNKKIRRHLKDIVKHFLLINNGEMSLEIRARDDGYDVMFDCFRSGNTIDYLGLEKKYDEWVASTKQDGWENLKKLYLLKEKGGKKDILTQIKKACESLQNYLPEEASVKDNQVLGTFNNLVTSVYDTSYADFSNRYSNVAYNDDNEKIKFGFNKDYEGYEHLCSLFNSYSILILPFKASEEKLSTEATNFNSAFTEFRNTLKKLYTKVDSETGEKKIDYSKMNSSKVNKDSKLAMYMTLKNLTDRHIGIIKDNEKQYNINENDSEFKRFNFLDTYYNDIGDKMMVSGKIISSLIQRVLDRYETGNGEGIVSSEISVYSFMSQLCESCNSLFMTLPIFSGALTGPEGAEALETMFKPIPYRDISSVGVNKGPTYICFYPHQPSKHLDLPNSQYQNDGVLINNNIDDIAALADFAGPTSINEWSEESNDGYIVPAFGVNYGQQNQNIFTNVNVNMDNPMVTEHAVAAMFNIANKEQTSTKNSSFEGQNLYDIYTNKSYTCNVEMMGCAQIMPLMYFQLNNIPMFRGAYMIINVEHDITPGNMKTSFKGVRINKNKIPMLKSYINFASIVGSGKEDTAYEGQRKKKKNKEKDINVDKPFNGTLIPAETGGQGLDGIPADANYSVDDFKNAFGKKFALLPVSYYTNATDGFNHLNKPLRQTLYAIFKDMVDKGYGIEINSSTRNKGSKGSDHYSTPIGGTYAGKRKQRTTLESVDAYGETKPMTNLGCAVDLDGRDVNDKEDKRDTSVVLFHLIATKYTDNIRQLLWEITSDAHQTKNYISNCVHYANYGPRGKNGNDATEIFVSHKEGDDWVSYAAKLDKKDLSKAPTNLPPMFIRTLYDMSLNGKLEGVTLNNFVKAGVDKSKLTAEILKGWCEQLNVLNV